MKDHVAFPADGRGMQEGSLVYRFETPAHPGNILYVNPVHRYQCTNECMHCGRPSLETEGWRPNIYEQKAGTSLFLDRIPSAEEVRRAISCKIKPDDSEVAIIGLGEPLIRLPLALDVIRFAKDGYHVSTRVDTNGQAGIMYKSPAVKLAQAGLDEARVSVNAINEPEYVALCRPQFKGAFGKVIEFVHGCIDAGIRTKASFVTGFDDGTVKTRSGDDYLEFAASLGIRPDDVILRPYIPPFPATDDHPA